MIVAGSAGTEAALLAGLNLDILRPVFVFRLDYLENFGVELFHFHAHRGGDHG